MKKNINFYGNWVVKIIIINVAVFLIQMMDPAIMEQMVKYLGLTPAAVLQEGYLWQIVSYMFLHGSFMHIFFNMYALLMFGMPIEQTWGSRRFLIYYFVTGAGAGITIFVINTFFVGGMAPYIPTIGASGAIFGVLLAFGILFPDSQILIFFIFPLKAKYLVVLYGLFTMGAVIATGGGGPISHAGHLGGLLFGLAWFLYEGRLGKAFHGKIFRTKLKSVSRENTARIEGQTQSRAETLKQILGKLRESGPESLTDDEFQQVRYMQIMHEKETDELCIEEDFSMEDDYCRNCSHLEACILREIRKHVG
jgi:membrane associated rhomboid family serine protease